MHITLDGVRLTLDSDTAADLQSLVNRAAASLSPGRLIVSITLNDEPLLDQALSDRLACPLEPGDHVVLESADRTEIVAAALISAAQQLADSSAGHESSADAIMAGNMRAGLEHVQALLEAWQACRDVIAHGSQVLGRDLTAEAIEDRSVQEHLSALTAALQNLRNAFEAQDTVLISDLLRYEMPPLASDWKSLLRSLAQRVTGVTSSVVATMTS